MDLAQIKSLIERDPELILHPASSISALVENGPQMITSGKGSYIQDAEGNKLLDAIAGLWCVNVGYGRMELTQFMKEAADQLAFYHTFSNASNPWQVLLAEKLFKYAPKGMGKVFFGSSGSDANDTLIKIAWHYHSLLCKPEKVKIIAREQAYHGTSISTAGLTGLGNFHKNYPIPLDFIVHTDCPHYYTRARENESEQEFCNRLIGNIEALIEREGADTIAAFFAEPIMAAGGIIEPPADYYPRLKKLLKENNILLVADEVVCGFGRLGSWFGSPLLDLEPDMLSSAKGVTSGYFPMSIAMISDAIWEVLKGGSETLGGFFHGYTYSGHPVGAAVGLANINIIEQEGLVDHAKSQGAFLHSQLRNAFADHPHVGEIRGRGMLAGIQLVENKAARKLPEPSLKWPLKVAQRVRQEGVIVRPLPSVGSIAISPPLNFSTSEVSSLINALRIGIDELN